MIILGIDPGTTRIGYGVIEGEKSPRLITCGLLKISSQDSRERISEAAESLRQIIKKYRPELMAMEKLFFMNNQKTGLAVAEVRGALTLVGHTLGVPMLEYAPTEIKSIVAGFGGADKKALAKMVALSLKAADIPGPDDVTDALAVGLAAFYSNPRTLGER